MITSHLFPVDQNDDRLTSLQMFDDRFHVDLFLGDVDALGRRFSEQRVDASVVFAEMRRVEIDADVIGVDAERQRRHAIGNAEVSQ